MGNLVFITGKGGVGKSAVTASLAARLGRSKKKTALIELGQKRMGDFFSRPHPFVTLFPLEAETCFEEYASLHLPKRTLFLLKNRWVRHFLTAVPGLNEILFLGKIYALLREETFDFLLVDAPSTGHFLALCDAPKIALKAFKTGALKTTIGAILEMLQNPKETEVLLVSQLEESIIHETIELEEEVRKRKWKVKGVVVNGRGSEALWQSRATKVEAPKPLAGLLKFLSSKKENEDRCLEELNRQTAAEKIFLPRIETAKSEADLKDKLGEGLAPWVLKR